MPGSEETGHGASERAKPHKPSPMSLAVEWVARITAVALVMVLPGIAGHWLDDRFGLNVLTLVGFAVGFVAGFVALLAMVKPRRKRSSSD